VLFNFFSKFASNLGIENFLGDGFIGRFHADAYRHDGISKTVLIGDGDLRGTVGEIFFGNGKGFFPACEASSTTAGLSSSEPNSICVSVDDAIVVFLFMGFDLSLIIEPTYSGINA
jgi:hypothetical protein